MEKVILGQEVKDKITGYKGIATSRTHYLAGCDRIEVQAPLKEDGTLPDICCFDEPQLEVIGRGILLEKVSTPKKTGGPHGRHLVERIEDSGRIIQER
jgi:hypothetical protein